MITSYRYCSYSFREGKGRERWETPETWEGAERSGMEGKKAKLGRLWAQKRVGGKWAGGRGEGSVLPSPLLHLRGLALPSSVN